MSADITKKKTLRYGLKIGIESVKFGMKMFEQSPSKMNFETLEDSVRALLAEIIVLRKTLKTRNDELGSVPPYGCPIDKFPFSNDGGIQVGDMKTFRKENTRSIGGQIT